MLMLEEGLLRNDCSILLMFFIQI